MKNVPNSQEPFSDKQFSPISGLTDQLWNIPKEALEYL